MINNNSLRQQYRSVIVLGRTATSAKRQGWPGGFDSFGIGFRRFYTRRHTRAIGPARVLWYYRLENVYKLTSTKR